MIASKQKKIRVLHILHSLDGGGAEHIVCDFAKHMASEVQMAVVCLDSAGALVDIARSLGVEVFVLSRKAGLDFSLRGKLSKIFNQFRPDIIHAHQYTPYMYAAVSAGLKFRGKIIFTEHGRHWPDMVSLKRRAFNKLLAVRADKITAVCEFVADAVREKEGFAAAARSGNIQVIPNGVNCNDFYTDSSGEIKAALASEFGFNKADPLCIQVARMHPVKDHSTAIAAFAEVCKKYPAARLLLVGDGQLHSELEKQVRDNSLEENVVFAGNRSDIPKLLAGSDIYLLSSKSEGASLSILEAMSASLPVIATDVGGNGELVIDGVCGLLSPRADFEAFASNICRLIGDEALRQKMGREARRRVEENFDQKHMHQNFLRLYRQISQVGLS